MTTTPYLEARIWVDGVEVLSERVDARTVLVEGLAEKHRAICEGAWDAGKIWVLELTDPDGIVWPLRLSNDPAECRHPIPLDDEATVRGIVEERWPT